MVVDNLLEVLFCLNEMCVGFRSSRIFEMYCVKNK